MLNVGEVSGGTRWDKLTIYSSKWDLDMKNGITGISISTELSKADKRICCRLMLRSSLVVIPAPNMGLFTKKWGGFVTPRRFVTPSGWLKHQLPFNEQPVVFEHQLTSLWPQDNMGDMFWPQTPQTPHLKFWRNPKRPWKRRGGRRTLNRPWGLLG